MQESKKKKQDKVVLNKTKELALIPEKLYFTIGEVSRLCQLKTHVLRYWEKEFPQLTPAKRRGNRRYYQRKDILVARQIKDLLYNQGFTIEGARSQLLKGVENPPEPTQPSINMSALLDDLEIILKDLHPYR